VGRYCFLILAVASTIFLSGCGKPPKDITEKIAFNYVGSMGGGLLELSDIKYLSAASKDGGYLVNIQAGDALCEMQMIKGDKEWLAKGISCNGSFLSPEKIAPRKKKVFTELIKKQAAETNAKEIVNNDGSTGKFAFDGKKYSMIFNTQVPAFEIDAGKKKTLNDRFTQMMCTEQAFRTAHEVGYDTGVDMISKDNKLLFSVTISGKDCK